MGETLLSPSNVLLFGRLVADLKIDHTIADHSPFDGPRAGGNRDVETVLSVSTPAAKVANFARIYGFSYEGTYYDLPRPIIYLVHGPGKAASDTKGATPNKPARAPAEPSLSGVAAADFDFADDVWVWSYDKADYTIRMDVETGTFEDVLLGILGGGGPGVSGARVSGARVSGARVSGARVSGARLSGGRGDAGD
jgi:hypothetical protein